jgi:hypothetical protein
MLWKLVIGLFLISDGATADKPSKIIKLNETFQTEQACKDYFDTSRQELKEMGMPENIVPKFVCIEVEDNSI